MATDGGKVPDGQTKPLHPSCAYRYVGPGGIYFCRKRPGHSDPHGSWIWRDPKSAEWFDPTEVK